MKALFIGITSLSILASSCSDSKFDDLPKGTPIKEESTLNPFFKQYETPHQIPPFADIKVEHYLPAITKGIQEQQAVVLAIGANSDAPSFENTVLALEYSGKLLKRSLEVFQNLSSSDTDSEMDKISQETAPLLAAHEDFIYMNQKLFLRFKALADRKLGLPVSDAKLLKDHYQNFVRSGAQLPEEQRKQLKAINQKLAGLSESFSSNVLAETNSFKLFIENSADLEGLPQSVINVAQQEAAQAGKPDQWLFTTHRSSFTSFMTYAKNRNLRKQMFDAYTTRGHQANEHDNRPILKEMVALRIEKSKLLGFKSHAHYTLANQMAETPEKVNDLLDKIWPKSLVQAKNEQDEMQTLMNKDVKGNLEAWDWWYYAEKLRKDKYDFDMNLVKPYFSLEASVKGIFALAEQLFDLKFIESTDFPKYHPEVKTYEVRDHTNKLVGIYFLDLYVRASKRGGAWMSAFREQYRENKTNHIPLIVNVLNLNKTPEGEPNLLTFEEAETLFHEFGHALHGLLSNTVYPSQSGTNVPRDFVEYPSQVLENWFTEPEVLKLFAKHHQTGEVIPQVYIDKINQMKSHNQGFQTVEYLAATYLDLGLHSLTQPVEDVEAFEASVLKEKGLLKTISPRYRSGYFLHIFAGGYSAGYYSYMWSQILDADTFAYFKEKGVLNKELAKKYRRYILSKGGSAPALQLYKRFRGREPNTDALMKRLFGDDSSDS